MTTTINFYFDPSCPFCWITSRWLLMVQSERDITVQWRPFSLAIKNDELSSNTGMHIPAHRVLRVMEVAASEHQASLIDMYTFVGMKHHVAGDDFNDDLILELLNEFSLPQELVKAADDEKYDDQLTKSVSSATDIAGDDIGVPTIIFDNETGGKQGFFGPVLQELPDKEEALKLWDGLSQLATNSSFYELKRSRPSGGPDVFSTAKC